MRIVATGRVYDHRWATGGPPVAASGRHRSCAFTAVVRLGDGTLLVTCRRGSARDSVDGHVCVFASEDDGHTWEERYDGFGQAVWGGVPGEEKTLLIAELTAGELLGSTLWVDRSDPSRPFINPETTGLLPMRIGHRTSRDGGRTWSTPHAVDVAPHPAASPTGPVIALPDGRLAQPYECWKWFDDPSPGRPAALLRFSADHGRSWPTFSTVAMDPTHRRFYWDQRLAVHPETRQLVAMFWTHDSVAGQDGDVHIAWGSPDGRVWIPPVSTGLAGQHCQPIPAGGNRLVAIYSRRRDPPGIRAVVSEDFGRTWDRASEVVLYDSRAGTEVGAAGARRMDQYWEDMERWRFGHPRGVLLPSGEVFAVYYAGDDFAKCVHWARLEV